MEIRQLQGKNKKYFAGDFDFIGNAKN